MSILEKAIQGKVPVYFVLAHGQDYSKSSQVITSVPRNKTLILPVNIGEQLSYDAAQELAKRFSSRQKLSNFLSTLPKQFTVLDYGSQFPDTLLKFHDPHFWTGIQKLPYKKFEMGLDKRIHTEKNTHMKGTSPTMSPRKKLSTFLNESPEEALYIIASCRGVKGVPANQIRATSTIPAQRTSAQKRKLESVKRETERKSKKRYTPPTGDTNKNNSKKRKLESTKKRKRTPSETSKKKPKVYNENELANNLSKLKI